LFARKEGEMEEKNIKHKEEEKKKVDRKEREKEWQTPTLEDVSEKVMAQPYIRFT
jgi:hypothetical protein